MLPTAMATGSPTDDQREVRPPTHSPNWNIRSSPTPHARARSGAAVVATKCIGTLVSPTASESQDLIVAAFVRVSSVVKVLDATITRVRFGMRRASVSATAPPSTLESACTAGPSCQGANARRAISGTQSRPPDSKIDYMRKGLSVGSGNFAQAHRFREMEHSSPRIND